MCRSVEISSKDCYKSHGEFKLIYAMADSETDGFLAPLKRSGVSDLSEDLWCHWTFKQLFCSLSCIPVSGAKYYKPMFRPHCPGLLRQQKHIFLTCLQRAHGPLPQVVHWHVAVGGGVLQASAILWKAVKKRKSWTVGWLCVGVSDRHLLLLC